AEVERVDVHPDVGGVLARLAHVRDLDQLEVGLVHRRLEALVALPVAVRLLDDDAALQQQPLQHLADVELLVLGVTDAERDVLEVAKQREARVVVGCGLHGGRLRGDRPATIAEARAPRRLRYTVRPPLPETGMPSRPQMPRLAAAALLATFAL